MRTALLELRYLDENSVQRAWLAHERTGTSLPTTLTELGLLTQDKLLEFWSEWLQLEKLEEPSDFEEDLIPLLTPNFLRNTRIVPIGYLGKTLRVATADPLDYKPLQTVSYILESDVVPVCASPRQIDALLSAAFENLIDEESAPSHLVAASHHFSDVAQLTALANEGPVVQQVNAIFNQAYEERVSDIHLEPQGDGLTVRFRVDGQLKDTQYFGPPMRTAVISRLKILGGMDITEQRLPQDGRSSVVTGGKKIDLRLSTLPTVDGESVVIRLLVQDTSALTWDALGFAPHIQAQLDEIIRRPVGLFLVTGPTGSGKTTTLYTALGKLDRKHNKIISVEDPVEYRIRGIMQVQVHQELGLDFASVLRTAMRHNPNTIMVGEIRDAETAQMAMRASMTGHQVFSTLHTDGAVSSINRLSDMGVPRYLLGAHINAIMSQRLVRVLCPHCKQKANDLFEPSTEHSWDESRTGINHFVAKGCSACNSTGYNGRTLVSELLVLSRNIRQLISNGSSWHEIREAVRAEGFRTQFEHGLALVKDGITSVEELLGNVEAS
ncbi:GspE/PulE family protein [Labrenzia sp. PHM005]|uniref:GspE/PulE family protein n=1 Tax=Labrenzia sp. PHM005 TaxID=2590016 RepID=UPI00113FE8AD|nr:GspE/PulE family protein [Labrenzia sp. PHM005]QDG74403.1 type II/IV secretion system protein [Labrenzia sp. PHM005]